MQHGFRFDVRRVMPARGLFFAFWSALGGLRGRKQVLFIGSWTVQEEFQDTKKGSKMGPQKFLRGLVFEVPRWSLKSDLHFSPLGAIGEQFWNQS